jgi:peptidoglycan hydrolase-like protein with peptidoglycan-binding domain
VRNRRANRRDGRTARVAALIAQHPRESVAAFMVMLATTIIFVNALFLQRGPHPAPIFASRLAPAPASPPVAMPHPRVIELPTAQPAAQAAAPRSRIQIITDIQRELSQRGFYDGAVDGVWGARTDAALRDFAQAAGLKGNLEAGEDLVRVIASSHVKAGKSATPERNDPIAQLLAPSKRILAIQRALADFGYGQIKPTGQFGPETKAAIEKFERDRKLPVTGQISDQLVRELAAVTSRPLE